MHHALPRYGCESSAEARLGFVSEAGVLRRKAAAESQAENGKSHGQRRRVSCLIPESNSNYKMKAENLLCLLVSLLAPAMFTATAMGVGFIAWLGTGLLTVTGLRVIRRRVGTMVSVAAGVAAMAFICHSESFGAVSAANGSFGEEARGRGVPSPNLASDAKGLPADPGKAAVLWEIRVGTHQYSIPTLDRGRIYIGANDTAFERPGYKPTRGGALYCVEQATGKLIWQMASPRYFEGVEPPLHFDQWGCGICSGPVVDGKRVYVVGNRGEVLCLDADGQVNGNDGPFKDEQAYMGITNVPGNEPRATDGDIIWKHNLLAESGVAPHDVCGSTLLLQIF